MVGQIDRAMATPEHSSRLAPSHLPLPPAPTFHYEKGRTWYARIRMHAFACTYTRIAHTHTCMRTRTHAHTRTHLFGEEPDVEHGHGAQHTSLHNHDNDLHVVDLARLVDHVVDHVVQGPQVAHDHTLRIVGLHERRQAGRKGGAGPRGFRGEGLQVRVQGIRVQVSGFRVSGCRMQA